MTGNENRRVSVERTVRREASAEAPGFSFEVEEVFGNSPRYDFIAKGHAAGDDVYRALGQTDAGRYLSVFFVYKHGGLALPISARDMDSKERKRYGKK